MTKVILISGKAGHGKSTFANLLQNELTEVGYHVFRAAFGDEVKDICSRYFDFNGTKDDRGRHILQYIGTDVVRKMYPNFWAESLAKLSHAVLNSEMNYDIVLVDDLRFPNEADAFYDIFGVENVITIRVNRFQCADGEYTNPDMSPAALAHISEHALDDYAFNFIVKNCDLRLLAESAEAIATNI